MKLFFRTLLPILFIIKSSILFGQFTDITSDSLPGVFGGDISLGDYDNDGDLDILETGYNSDSILITYVIKNNNGVFELLTPISDTIPGLVDGSVDWVDLNNDGFLDILISGTSDEGIYQSEYNDPGDRKDGATYIYINQGNDSFEELMENGMPVSLVNRVALGDIDQDNNIDLFLTTRFYENTKWLNKAEFYTNDGKGKFTQVNSFYNEDKNFYLPFIPSFADVNSDGILDILLNDRFNGFSPNIYFNIGTEYNFYKAAGFMLGGDAIKPKWGDYNNDGLLDLVTNYAGFSYYAGTFEGNPYLYQNNPEQYNYPFLNHNHEPDSIIPKITNGDYSWVDFDSDGDLDLSAFGFYKHDPDSINGKAFLFINESGKLSQQLMNGVSPLRESALSWGDLDNDGDMDLVVTGMDKDDKAVIKIYQNSLGSNTFIKNTPPSAPVNLSESFSKNDVIFNWESANDQQTATKGLSYNLFVISEDSSVVLGNPMADIQTGKRKISLKGMINGGMNSWKIVNLPSGKYNWAIQAIDGCFEGSEFSVGGSFEINLNPPTNFKCIAYSSTQVDLSWEDNSEEEKGYVISRKGSEDDDYTKYWNFPENTTSFFDFTAKPNQKYTYKISFKYDYDKSGYAIDSLETPEADLIIKEINLPQIFDDYASLNWADYDKNGFLDLGITTTRNNSEVYQYDADYNFSANHQSSPLNGADKGSLNWVDIDNDSDLDISITGITENNSAIILYENIGAGEFQKLNNHNLPKIVGNCIAWGDCDNDGDLDAFISGKSSFEDSIPNFARIYINNGDKTFSLLNEVKFEGINLGRATWVDLNNDGLQDLVYSNESPTFFNNKDITPIFKIYKNTGNYIFEEIINPEFSNHNSFSIKDYNYDGLNDIISLNPTDDSLEIIFCENSGDFQFLKKDKFIPNIKNKISQGRVKWIDFDGNGIYDIVIWGRNSDEKRNIYGSFCKLFLGSESGVFTEKINTGFGDLYGIIDFIDIDNDGDLDLFNHTGSKNINLFINPDGENSLTKNTAPSIPSNLVSIKSGNAVTLYWNTSEDTHSPTSSLTYNLVIKKNDSLIINPQSLEDGTLLTPHHGNMEYNTTFTLKNLELGTYKWSLQAIDQSYAASSFADWQEFTIKESFTVSGNLMDQSNENPINNASIEIFRINKNDSIEFIKSLALVDKNTFEFEGEDGDKYLLVAIPDSISYPELSPTFYGNKLSIEEAEILELSEDTTISISVLTKSINTYKITGTLITQNGEPVNQGIIEVYQTSEESTNIVKSISLTDSNTFEFEGEDGDKYLLVAIPDSISYPELIPTFYGGKLTLEEAEIIELSKDTTISITIQHKPKTTYKITGTLITQNGELVNQGAIEVYQTSDDSTNLIKSISLTDSNTFDFEGGKDGRFVLKAIPDQAKYPNLLPTYFGDVLLFNEAEVVELSEDKSVTITLLEKAEEQTGNSTIEGLALETEGNEGGRISQGFATEGTPIPDLPIYLLNKEKALVDLDTTDSNGLFKFENINSEEYQLAADYNNKPLSLNNSLFEITENGQTLQLSLLVGDSLSVEITSITGLEDFEPIEGVTIYPNPVENVIQVNIQNQINGNYELEILDITGKSIIKQRLKKSNQNMVESIDLAELTKGIYFLKIRKGNTLVLKRLVKG